MNFLYYYSKMATRTLTIKIGVNGVMVNIFPETRWQDLKILVEPSYFINHTIISHNEARITYKDEDLVPYPTNTTLRFEYENTCSKCNIKFNHDYILQHCTSCVPLPGLHKSDSDDD
jgi:hypothetical protein